MRARLVAFAVTLGVGLLPGPGRAAWGADAPGPSAPPTPPAPPPIASPREGAVTTTERDVRVPMRDGAWLAANVLRPAAPGRYPAIVVQTPYDKDRLGGDAGDLRAAGAAGRGSALAWAAFDRAHYAYVVVDWRGFHGSREAVRGVDRGGVRRGQDGYDVVEWTAAQPWCDGRVGTWGGSALGKQQFDTAAERPPHLVCAVPLIAFMGQRYEGFHEGGVRLEAHARTLEALGFSVGALAGASPLPSAPLWTLARRRTYRPERIEVPCLLVSGWWDHFPREVVETFEDLLARGGEGARRESRLVLGPWSHTAIDVAEQGDVAFPAAEGYSTAITRRFFDRFLRDVTQGWEEVPRVHLFQTGEERWVCGARVGDLLGTPTTFALDARGGLAPPTAADVEPTAFRPTRTYRYDPLDPPPTLGGRNLPPLPHGPRDLAPRTRRPDVLTWTSAPLPAPLATRGEAEAALVLLCDRPDVDVVVHLGDAGPDGRVLLVGETALRASLRDGATARPLRPGEPVALRLRFPPHAYTFGAGHRIALLVASGDAPRYERNPHTGAGAWDAAHALDVRVTLLLGPGDATLTLPVVASPAAGAREPAR